LPCAANAQLHTYYTGHAGRQPIVAGHCRFARLGNGCSSRVIASRSRLRRTACHAGGREFPAPRNRLRPTRSSSWRRWNSTTRVSVQVRNDVRIEARSRLLSGPHLGTGLGDRSRGSQGASGLIEEGCAWQRKYCSSREILQTMVRRGVGGSSPPEGFAGVPAAGLVLLSIPAAAACRDVHQTSTARSHDCPLALNAAWLSAFPCHLGRPPNVHAAAAGSSAASESSSAAACSRPSRARWP
jgi:hypothetical protein